MFVGETTFFVAELPTSDGKKCFFLDPLVKTVSEIIIFPGVMEKMYL